ncbi:MAG: hypothetical protein ACE5JM_11380, partial [Armatimonadota bacterium]
MSAAQQGKRAAGENRPDAMGRDSRLRLVLAVVLLVCAGEAVAAPMSLGPFRPEPALTLYIVSDGEPCALSVTYTKGGRDGGDRLLTRLFDADEKLIFREYETPEPD